MPPRTPKTSRKEYSPLNKDKDCHRIHHGRIPVRLFCEILGSQGLGRWHCPALRHAKECRQQTRPRAPKKDNRRKIGAYARYHRSTTFRFSRGAGDQSSTFVRRAALPRGGHFPPACLAMIVSHRSARYKATGICQIKISKASFLLAPRGVF